MIFEKISRSIPPALRMPVAAIVVSVSYFLSGKVALNLSFQPDYISALWPPNGIVLAALLLTNPRQWWWYILSMVPAELAADLPSGIPLQMALAFVGADCIEVFTAAFLLRHALGVPLRLNSSKSIALYALYGVIIAPFIAAFFGAYVPVLGGANTEYIMRWRMWFMSDALTHLILTPCIFLWLTWEGSRKGDRTVSRIVELIMLISGILTACFFAFNSDITLAGHLPSLVYVPLPFLIWASVRFGLRGIFTLSLLCTVIMMWSASRGFGPFSSESPMNNVFHLQVFLFLALSPLILLATVIAERERGESAVKESEKRFRLLADVAFDGITVTEGGVVQEANDEFARIFEYAPSEIIGMHLSKLIVPEFQENVMEHMKSGYDQPYESICLKKDGTQFPVEMYGRNFSYNERALRITAIQNISERKKLEEELQKSQKLESIGVLAGGIAHDFNNLLTAIMNNVYLSMKSIACDSDAVHRLEAAEKAIRRAGDLTQQLLTFSKGGAPVKKATSITEVIKDSAEFALRGSHVKCIFDMADNLWTVEIDASQISQVIHNLIINAVQAMPDGGVIRISAENAVISSDKDVLLRDGRYVKVRIQDEGMGMSEEYLQKIFDPYFTSKEMGRGLGLAVAYSIIKNHDGNILAESKINRGSTFTIYLSSSEKPVGESETTTGEPVSGRGRILIMDDDEAVRSSVGEILNELGYEIDYAKDGLEAIAKNRKAEESVRPFDAVILDLTVPGGMGGKEAVKKIREIDPQVKAIISSGYSNDPVMANFRDYGFDAVISKPYNITDLSKVLHAMVQNKDY